MKGGFSAIMGLVGTFFPSRLVKTRAAVILLAAPVHQDARVMGALMDRHRRTCLQEAPGFRNERRILIHGNGNFFEFSDQECSIHDEPFLTAFPLKIATDHNLTRNRIRGNGNLWPTGVLHFNSGIRRPPVSFFCGCSLLYC